MAHDGPVVPAPGIRIVRFTRVNLEVTAWSEHTTEVRLRPVTRRIPNWGRQRQRRYFALGTARSTSSACPWDRRLTFCRRDDDLGEAGCGAARARTTGATCSPCGTTRSNRMTTGCRVPPARCGSRRRHRDRRRRFHRSLDRLPPARATTRTCASPCSNGRPQASGRPDATAAGASATSRHRCRRSSRQHGRDAAVAMVRAMQASVDQVGEVLRVARRSTASSPRAARSTWPRARRSSVATNSTHAAPTCTTGSRTRYTLPDPERDNERSCNATAVHGGAVHPHCAAVQPACLARGIARAVERLGGAGHEQTRRAPIDPRQVRTVRGTCVPRSWCARPRRTPSHASTATTAAVLPVGNFMIATEPIADDVWDEIGLRNRECFEDSPHLLAYGQRTADGRIAWGGRAAPSRWRSRVPPSPMHSRVGCDPARGTGSSNGSRCSAVSRSPTTGAASSPLPGTSGPASVSIGQRHPCGPAGYFGSGVAASQAAGRTLADLIARARHGPRTTSLGRAPLASVGARTLPLARRARGGDVCTRFRRRRTLNTSSTASTASSAPRRARRTAARARS